MHAWQNLLRTQEHRRCGRGGCRLPAAMSRRSVLSSRWGTPSPAGRPRNTDAESNLRRMPGDRPMRRLRDSVRRTVRRLGWAVRRDAPPWRRTWPGAGGRMDKQRRPEQRGKRDPVTLPRPDLPIVLLSHLWAGVVPGVTESGRTANRGAGGLVTAHRHCRTSPTPSGYTPPTRTAVVGEHDHQCSASTWSPSRGSSTRPSPASQERLVPTVRRCAWSRSTARALACYVEDRAVLGGLVHRMAMGPSRRRDRPAGRAWGAECAGAVGRTAGRDAGCPCHQPRLGREEGVDGAQAFCHPRRRAGPYRRAELVSQDLG